MPRRPGPEGHIPRRKHGVYPATDQLVAPELADTQDMAHLAKFSDRLALAHNMMKENGLCRCSA